MPQPQPLPAILEGVRFVYFDAGYTLLHPEPSVGDVYSQVGEQFGHFFAEDRLNEAFPLAWRKVRAKALESTPLPYGRTLEEAEVFWTRVVRRTLEFAGYSAPDDPPYYAALFHHFEKADCWQLYPDVLPTLDFLDGLGVPYGILSNWDPRLHAMLEAMGFRDRFAQVIVSCDVGAEKPAPEIYRTAMAAAGVGPEEILHIGDEPAADGVGPREAGWRSVVIRRGSAPGRFQQEAEDLAALFEIQNDEKAQ